MKRSIFGLIAAAPVLAAGYASAQDQAQFTDVALPDTIRVIVAYSAGGSSDALARVTMPAWERYVEELSGQDTSAVVVNLPGAGGEIGWTALANADPDGSTIGIINLPAVPLVQAAREAGFEPWLDAFVPLGVNVVDPNVVRVSKESDYGSLPEAVQAATENPGSVTVGADGPLSDDHLAAYIIEQGTGAKFAFIPYAGGAPANRAFSSGEVDIAIGNVFDHLQTEEAAADAAVFRSEPYDMIAKVEPVGGKLGIDVLESGSTRGFAAPAGVPDDLVALYEEAFRRTFNDGEYKKAALDRNITIVEPKIGEEFGALMQREGETVDRLLQYFIEGGYIEPSAQEG